MADKLNPVTTEEIDLAYSGPAPLTNKFIMRLMGPVARIAFMELESPKKLPQFRSAVTMLLPDAIELRDLLVRMLANVEVIKEEADPNHDQQEP